MSEENPLETAHVLGKGEAFYIGDYVRVLWCYSGNREHINAVGKIVGFGTVGPVDAFIRPDRHIELPGVGSGERFSEGAFVRFDDDTMAPYPQCLTDDIEHTFLSEQEAIDRAI